MADGKPGFWSTLPGILTGLAALVASMTGLFAVFNRAPSAPAVQPASGPVPAPAALADAPAPAVHHPATTPTPPAHAEVRATVVDPDGWTNLRAGPSASSAIVARVNEGEVFWTRPRDGLWWRVRTASGVEGYVHRSRVRLNP